jgi:hypothetical protein
MRGRKEENCRAKTRFYVSADLGRRARGRLEEMSGDIERGTFAALRLGGGPEHHIDLKMFQTMERMRDKTKWRVGFVGCAESLIMTRKLTSQVF